MATPTAAVPRDIETRLRKIEAFQRDVTSKLLSRSRLGVSAGDFTVAGGGSVIIRDGGGFFATWTDGTVAAMFGPLTTVLGGDRKGLALANDTGGIYLSGNYDPAAGTAALQAGLSAPLSTLFLQAETQSVLAGPNLSRVLLDGNGLQLRGSLDPGTGAQVGSAGVKITPHGTTASSPNCVIDASTGLISRSTSSRRYKQDIAPVDVDVDAALALVPQVFRTKDEVHELGDDAPTHVGFIAEDAADLGLDAWVKYDDEGPEAFDYATWCVALQAIVRQQSEQITDLAARLAALEDA